MRFLALASAAFLTVTADARAQEVSLRVGDRVRVTASTPLADNQVGTVVAIEAQMLVVTVDSALRYAVEVVERRYPIEAITRLERSLGKKYELSNTITGAVIGALGGAAIGAVAATAYCSDSNEALCQEPAGTAAAMGGAAGALGGLLIGGVIGSLIKAEQWQEIRPDRLRVSLVQRGGGGQFGIALSAAF